jgi:hypothetical protein
MRLGLRILFACIIVMSFSTKVFSLDKRILFTLSYANLLIPKTDNQYQEAISYRGFNYGVLGGVAENIGGPFSLFGYVGLSFGYQYLSNSVGYPPVMLQAGNLIFLTLEGGGEVDYGNIRIEMLLGYNTLLKGTYQQTVGYGPTDGDFNPFSLRMAHLGVRVLYQPISNFAFGAGLKSYGLGRLQTVSTDWSSYVSGWDLQY